jgi:hypothetical protein
VMVELAGWPMRQARRLRSYVSVQHTRGCREPA